MANKKLQKSVADSAGRRRIQFWRTSKETEDKKRREDSTAGPSNFAVGLNETNPLSNISKV